MLSDEVMHVIESQKKQMQLMRILIQIPFSFRSFTRIWQRNIDMIRCQCCET